jgi:hypothetical protein
MRLTNKAREELRRVLYHAERAQSYINRREVAVCSRRSVATTTLDYVRPSDGAVLTESNKEIGSDLCGLSMAIERLSAFLVRH